MSQGERAPPNPKRRAHPLRSWKGILGALVVAAAAYVAWIPAVADNAHPTLALLAGIVFFGALLAAAILLADAIWRNRSSPYTAAMAEGEQRASAINRYFLWSALRSVAVAVLLAGVVVRFALGHDELGTYLIAAGVVVAAIDDIRSGEVALGAMMAGLAAMVVASSEDWTALSNASAVVILVAAGFALYRWTRSTSTGAPSG